MIDAMVKYGVPRKLRSDCGTENVDVERYAKLLREAGYKIIYMKGPSVHNQRIEVSPNLNQEGTGACAFRSDSVCHVPDQPLSHSGNGATSAPTSRPLRARCRASSTRACSTLLTPCTTRHCTWCCCRT